MLMDILRRLIPTSKGMGKYKKLSVIASGSMATVHMVTDAACETFLSGAETGDYAKMKSEIMNQAIKELENSLSAERSQWREKLKGESNGIKRDEAEKS